MNIVFGKPDRRMTFGELHFGEVFCLVRDGCFNCEKVYMKINNAYYDAINLVNCDLKSFDADVLVVKYDAMLKLEE